MDLYFLYVDHNNTLVSAKKKTIAEDTIDKDMLIDIIQSNSNTYSLKTLLKFTEKKEPYLFEISPNENVVYNHEENESILKTLYFVYKKKLKHNSTKKIIFTSAHRKTKRKAT